MNPVEQISTKLTSPRRRFTISSRVMPQFIVALDTAVILSAAVLTYVILEGRYTDRTDYYVFAALFVWLVGLLLMNFAGLYQFQPILRPTAFVEKFVVSLATTFLFLFALAFSLKISELYSRLWIGTFAIGTIGGLLAARLIAARIIRTLADKRVFTRNTVICGYGQQASQLLAHIEKMRPQFISVIGLFSDAALPAGFGPGSRLCPVLGTPNDIAEYVRRNEIDDVMIALPWSSDEQIAEIVATLRELPVNVYLGADMIGFRLALREAPDHFGDLPLVEIMGRPLSGWGALFKNAEDCAIGTFLAALLSPVMLLIGIAIKLDSPGPVLFRQRRHRFINKTFEIYKFRTMKHTAECAGKTPQATPNDPRVTRVGHYLRRWSLDELPQIFNVLNGTMSLVGPRPHAIDHNEEYSREIRGYFARHRVKPGITGWAQVNGFRGQTDIEKMKARVKHDIFYVENWSLFFDLKILAMTGLACLTGRNAY